MFVFKYFVIFIFLTFLILLSIGKIGYGIRFELINRDFRFLFGDYRHSIENSFIFRYQNILIYLFFTTIHNIYQQIPPPNTGGY